MDSRVARLNQSKQRLMRCCRVFKWGFYIAFIVYCLVMAIVLFYSVVLPDGFSYVGPQWSLTLASIICDTISGGLVLFLLGRLLSFVGKGQTPFSDICVKLFVVMGAALLASVVCQALIDPGTMVGAVDGNNEVAIVYDSGAEGSRNISVRGIVESIACFVLAAIFKYGALLQEEADDLV